MREKEIRKYADLMIELDLTGLEIQDETGSVRIERSSVGQVLQAHDTQRGSAAVGETDKEGMQREGAKKEGIAIKSPLVGVFYTSPTENAEPYVKPGDHVSKGQTLCLIEAMKLMNEITAETDGVITDVSAVNGQAVEYGTQLFCLRREA